MTRLGLHPVARLLHEGKQASLGLRLILLTALLLELAFPVGGKAEDLKLLISIKQPSLTSPFPARITLHLANAGQKPLWLYHKARNQPAPAESPPASGEMLIVPSKPIEGSTLAVHLVPAEGQGTAQGKGTVFESVGLPHPKLVHLGPGEDYEESEVIRLLPATRQAGGEKQPVWGGYRLALTYAAKYSNAEELERILGVNIWQGEVTSNTIEIELKPSSAAGSVAGTVAGPDSQGIYGALVSLADEQDHLAGQIKTDSEGRFSFSHLPLGLYWVTARRAEATEDTAVFRHARLTAQAPAEAVEIELFPPESHEPKQLLHKPVLILVSDSAGRPVDKAALEITWSNGTVMDSVKARTSEDGLVAVDLIPGRNYVTLMRSGCPAEEQRQEVAEGDGIDGFKLVIGCSPK